MTCYIIYKRMIFILVEGNIYWTAHSTLSQLCFRCFYPLFKIIYSYYLDFDRLPNPSLLIITHSWLIAVSHTIFLQLEQYTLFIYTLESIKFKTRALNLSDKMTAILTRTMMLPSSVELGDDRPPPPPSFKNADLTLPESSLITHL